jgi:GNAT superfamily N-acetyltransferase
MPKSSIIVRHAVPADSEAILMLIDALADYEKLDPPTEEAKQRLLADAFAERPRFDIFLAEMPDKSLVGYAFVLENYSTFLALPTLYLEDLFVLPEARGTGAGSALFSKVAAEAKRRGCGRVEFVVLDWNTLAQDFYKRKGAKHLTDWHFYRLDAENFDSVIGS